LSLSALWTRVASSDLTTNSLVYGGLIVPLVVSLAQGTQSPPLIAPLQPWALLAALGPTLFLTAKGFVLIAEWWLKLRDKAPPASQSVTVSTGTTNGGDRVLAKLEAQEQADLRGEIENIARLTEATRGLLSGSFADRLDQIETTIRKYSDAVSRLALTVEGEAMTLDLIRKQTEGIPDAVRRNVEVHELVVKAKRKRRRSPKKGR